jgi:pyrroline-5-carboxylate reductase
MTNLKIAVIGCGNLGLSLIQGFIEDKKIPSKNITATKRNIGDIIHLRKNGITITADNIKAVQESEIVLIAVKPYDVPAILSEVKNYLDPERHIILSVATGITIDQIREYVQVSLPVFRAMPNMAANVRESVTCISHFNARPETIKSIVYLFDIIGTTIIINEELMESATVLGACGVAYVLRFIRAMIQGGIQIGFDAKTASKIVYQTVKGAAELLIERHEHPEFEIDKVTTPKGCTIAGLNEMEHNGFSSSLIKGIITSYSKIEKRKDSGLPEYYD